MNRLYSALLLGMVALVAPVALATTIVLPTDDQLIAKSPLILSGDVLESAAVEENGRIFTVTRIAVEQLLKGSAAPMVEIREIGGQVGDRFNVVYGSPRYTAGERVMVFLWPTGRGDYQTRDLFVGKFTERFTVDGDRLWFRDFQLAGTQLLDGTLQPVPERNVQRRAEQFSSYVAARAAGLQPARDYEVENPQLAREVHANFTLIAEPAIYRWFAFDGGGSASWVSVGTQPGFNGGGVNEISTAMSSWNNASGARINYVYSGATSASAGGLSTPNGRNEVLLNDPLNEIDGTFSGSGVIGRGGFNNVQNGGSWTSGYAADASHPLRTYSNVGNIIEGNLVIQDGISPSAGFTSNLLAAVLAHEFGHTLGLGHSADQAALMYASLQSGRGPGLHTDDVNAAKWLYPGTSGGTPTQPSPDQPPTTTVPAAPSNLSASIVNGNQILLNWTVNATNASSQRVYVATGAETTFSLVGEISATRNSAILSGLSVGVTYRVRITARNSAGESAPSNTVQATVPTATTPTILSLGANRFRLTLEARDHRTGRTGVGIAIPQNDLFGYFSIPDLTGNPSNPEVFVKMLNGQAVNGKFWVFWGGLTDLEYTIRVTDLSSGATQSYFKQGGSACGGYDTSAFNSSLEAPLEFAESGSLANVQILEVLDLQADACSSGGANLCVNAGRFQITLSAKDPRTGSTAPGQALPQNDLFGYFSIPGLTGNAANPEVFVKVLDGRAANGRFWVFYGGLTDLEYRVTVTDTFTGTVKGYTKPAGSACGGFDSSAF